MGTSHFADFQADVVKFVAAKAPEIIKDQQVSERRL
jgi:hypothetical protein